MLAGATLQVECCFNTTRALGEAGFVDFGLSNGEEMCGVLVAVAGHADKTHAALELDAESPAMEPSVVLHKEATRARMERMRFQDRQQDSPERKPLRERAPPNFRPRGP